MQNLLFSNLAIILFLYLTHLKLKTYQFVTLTSIISMLYYIIISYLKLDGYLKKIMQKQEKMQLTIFSI